jgi:hypothetical protein
MPVSSQGGNVIQKFLVSILLMVGLAGCGVAGAAGGGVLATPTNVEQMLSQAAEVTGEVATTPIVDKGAEAMATSVISQVAERTSTPNPIVPVPSSSVQIEGVPYMAYQIPGDPFRIVCQEPCSLDLKYIYAEYAGFRLARVMLIQLTGIDTLAELQPVDMHLVIDDSICKELLGGHAYIYAHKHQAYTCTEGPGYYPTLAEKIQNAVLADAQYFPLHEYMHTIFFGRISGTAGNFEDSKAAFMHDFVVPIPSYAIGILDPAGFCTYRNPLAPGDYGGWLISELCQQDGFQLKDLALSLIELDKLYQSGGGQVNEPGYAHPVPTVAQYHDILNGLLGTDTTNAFAAACWPPQLFGNRFTLSPACVSISVTNTPANASAGTPTPIK